MSYRCDGYGEFTLRKGMDSKEAFKAAQAEEFEIVEEGRTTFTISFSGWAVGHARKQFEVLSKYFNGTFEVKGEEATDVWYLEFKDGKWIFTPVEIKKGKPEVLDENGRMGLTGELKENI